MFNLAIMMCEDTKIDLWVILAEVFSLFMLFREMVAEDVENRMLFDAMKDVSQNRLSKFELALLLTKITEDVVKEPAVCNFVEHFYTNPENVRGLGEGVELGWVWEGEVDGVCRGRGGRERVMSVRQMGR
jgi:hypothetical protein